MARKKRPPDDESVIRLTKKYSDISEKLRTIILQPTTANLAEHKENITEATKAAEKTLTKANKAFGKDLKEAYDSSAGKMIRAVSSKGVTFSHESVAGGRNATEFKNVRRGAFMDLQTGMVGALSGLRKTVAETIQALDNKNRNLWEFTHAIENKLRENNLLEVTYENGAHIRLDHYAKMLARSSRIETENLGNFAAAEQLGTDLVQCVGQSPTCELCAIYRNRVFSVSGKDKRFPALYNGENAPLRNGYHVIHPNCRCEFMPYFEEIEGEERTKKAMEYSNRPFEDNRTKKERDAYADWQAGNRQLWAEQDEYEQMQRMLGNDMPYKTLGGFRRAKRDYNDAVKAGKLDKNVAVGYNNYATVKRALADKKLQAKVIAERPKKIESGKQGKHIRENNNYIDGRSYLTITEQEAQTLVNKYAGHGVLERTDTGRWKHTEIVVADKIVGVIFDKFGKEIPTKSFKIHYSKNGTHIVPRKET